MLALCDFSLLPSIAQFFKIILPSRYLCIWMKWKKRQMENDQCTIFKTRFICIGVYDKKYWISQNKELGWIVHLYIARYLSKIKWGMLFVCFNTDNPSIKGPMKWHFHFRRLFNINPKKLWALRSSWRIWETWPIWVPLACLWSPSG